MNTAIKQAENHKARYAKTSGASACHGSIIPRPWASYFKALSGVLCTAVSAVICRGNNL